MHIIKGKRKENIATEKRNRLRPTVHEDLKFVRKVQKDQAAAEQLIARLAPRVRHAVYMAVGRDEEADDLAHTCLVEILENIGNYKGTGSLEGWAGQLSFRVLMRQLSRKRRSERTVSLVPIDPGISQMNPERDTLRSRLRSKLATHLQKLPEERRMALVLRLVYQHSVAEVAELTGAPINTVRDRLRVGLKELRQSILRDPETREFLGEERHG